MTVVGPVIELQVGLDKARTSVDVNLAQERVARINESMRTSRRNDDNAACLHLALFVSDRDGSGTFESECDFHVRMLVQRRALPRFGLNDVGRERRALSFADELMRHSNERQMLEIDEAHGGIYGKIREVPGF